MGNHGGEVTMVVIGGTNRQLTSRHVATILGISWGAFILSWLANGVYYQVFSLEDLLGCLTLILRGS